jgi:dynein heavy chain
MGDQLSDHYLSAADDLFHLRIPRIWCKMTGTTAPPYTYNAAQWLRDLEDRWKHFEKILSMVRILSYFVFHKELHEVINYFQSLA